MLHTCLLTVHTTNSWLLGELDDSPSTPDPIDWLPTENYISMILALWLLQLGMVLCLDPFLILGAFFALCNYYFGIVKSKCVGEIVDKCVYWSLSILFDIEKCDYRIKKN